ncbi:hypothetical protein V1477_003385 [Vespula maculifrons]|uniref:Uncharacterized protein n=1 Tax=Vespula maculifrons TaxID=7453 RepID=A0ABD2CUI3_VESMC
MLGLKRLKDYAVGKDNAIFEISRSAKKCCQSAILSSIEYYFLEANWILRQRNCCSWIIITNSPTNTSMIHSGEPLLHSMREKTEVFIQHQIHGFIPSIIVDDNNENLNEQQSTLGFQLYDKSILRSPVKYKTIIAEFYELSIFQEAVTSPDSTE